MDSKAQLEHVAKYYGQALQSNADLRTSACCPTDAVPLAHQSILSKLHTEVTSKFYGCGSPVPNDLDGATVLDLGCGTGRDVYLASALVGLHGKVIGVDMTEAQLKVARAHVQYHSRVFFGDPNACNVDFRHGYIEDLSSAGIPDESVDVVISNCVCNLSPDKDKVFSEVYRSLKDGGEFYFSDVYADRRLQEEAKRDPVLVGECLGGALYLEDFRRIMSKVGFQDIRVVSATPISLTDETLLPLVTDVTFYSVTIRAFKLPSLEDRRENYGQAATYSSLDDSSASTFTLDVDNEFCAGVKQPVDANTAAILTASRFSKKFEVTPRTAHLGLFQRTRPGKSVPAPLDCFRPTIPQASTIKSSPSNNSCCPTSLSSPNPSASTPSEPVKPSCKPGCC